MRASCEDSVGMRPGCVRNSTDSGSTTRLTETCQGVNAIDVHCTAATNTFATAAAEREGRVQLVLDPNQGIEHHRARSFHVERV